MRILVLYMYYLRPGDPGIRRFNEFARLWAEAGHQVTVVTGQIHHNSKAIYPDLAGKAVARELDGAVEVYRVAGPATYHAGLPGRAFSQLGWARRVTRLLRKLPRADVVIGSSPPLFIGWPAVAAKRRFRVPLVFEVRDMWPEALVQLRVASARHPAVRYLARLERWAYAKADHLVTIVETQKNSIASRGLKGAADISVVTNGVILEDFAAVDPQARGRIRGQLGVGAGELLVLYLGSHGPLHNVATLVELAGELRGRGDGSSPNNVGDGPSPLPIHLISVGDGPDRPGLQAEAARRGLANLRFIGSIPAHDVPAYLSAADIGLSLVNTTAGTGWDSHTRGVFRNAFFDLAAARLPIVFNVPGYTRDELEGRANAGIFADTNAGPQAMANAVLRLAADPALRAELGENAYREIAVKYNRRKMAAEYLQLMRRLVAQPG